MNLSSSVIELSRKINRPFYTIDLDLLKSNYLELLSSGQSVRGNFKIAFAFKSNYLPIITQKLVTYNSFIEVFSENEWNQALALGSNPNQLICNGPSYDIKAIDQITNAGTIINIDSIDQLKVLIQLAQQNINREFKFGLRLSLSLQTSFVSRFGITENELTTILPLIESQPNILLTSLHTHIVEEARSTSSFSKRGREMTRLYKTYFSTFPITTINLGGGFYSPMPPELAITFNEPIPTIEEYGKAVSESVKGIPKNITLVIEPGSLLVANTMRFFCSVTGMKTRESKDFIFTNASRFDIQPTMSNRNLPMYIHHQGNKTISISGDITGNTGMENDILYHGYNGSIAIDDLLEFQNVGAYAQALRPQFIHATPKTYIVTEDELIFTPNQDSFEDSTTANCFNK